MRQPVPRRKKARSALAIAGLVALVPVRASLADEALLDDRSFDVRSSGRLVVDGGLLVALPTALPTGLSTGIGAGISHGRTLAWGARVSWSRATEWATAWTVTQSDLRLRATGSMQAAAGRGSFALRLGLGGTLVHETRLRSQGARAGLSGSALETSTLAMLPAADLQGIVALHVAGPWLMVVSGGPTAVLLEGAPRWGWSAELGVAWQP